MGTFDLPRPHGWTDDDVHKLEDAIVREVNRQVHELLDDPRTLATMLVYALRQQQDRDRKRSAG